MTTELEFYIYRFLLGLCEASLYPVIYSLLIPNWFLPKERAKAISLMLTSLLFSNIIGGPLAGILLDTTFFGLHGWRTLFIVEAIPAVIFAFIFAFWMKERPDHASWVTDAEKAYIKAELEKEEQQKQAAKKYTIWQALKRPKSIAFSVNLFLVGYWFLGL